MPKNGNSKWGASVLCEKHKGAIVIANIGKCDFCGNPTSSGLFHVCVTCAREKELCQLCYLENQKQQN